MPDRSRIHWSEVSITRARSSFLTSRSPVTKPVPRMRVCSMVAFLLLRDGRDPVAGRHLRLAGVEVQLLAAGLEVAAHQIQHELVHVEGAARLGRVDRVAAVRI